MKPFKADDLIKQAIKRHGKNLSISCSFGKDSIVVLHMALKHDPDIKVIFNNTGVEFPETIKYKEKIKRLWNLNLIETKPGKSKTFWECVDKYGLPRIRKSGGKGANSPRCCHYLKEEPALLSWRKHKITAILTGLQESESRSRKLLALRYDNGKAPYMSKDNISFCSQRWYKRSTSMWTYNPIMKWTNKDVWDYIKKNKIPINPVYLKWNKLYKRCGCLPCTSYIDWEKKLSKSHNKLYLKLKLIQNQEKKNGK